MTKILFAGPVGSGKSTQAEILGKYLHIPFFQSGQITRELSKENSDLGRKVKDIMESGRLVDDQTISEVVKNAIGESDLSRGFIFDGFPRSLKQLEIFDPKFDLVFNFKISDKQVLERLLKRKRVDDMPEAIEQRLKIYYEQTQPLIEYYKKLGILREINANGSIEEIQSHIKKILEVNG